MGASEIGMKEKLPQKRHHKNNLIVLVQVKKLTAVVQLKNHGKNRTLELVPNI